jgi:hypothetical protein
MRRAVLYVCLATFAGYVSASAVLWARQTHLIFEPVRAMVLQPGELGFPVADVTIPVPGAGAGRQTLHAWWMPAPHADTKLVLYFRGNEGNVSTSIGETASPPRRASTRTPKPRSMRWCMAGSSRRAIFTSTAIRSARRSRSTSPRGVRSWAAVAPAELGAAIRELIR